MPAPADENWSRPCSSIGQTAEPWKLAVLQRCSSDASDMQSIASSQAHLGLAERGKRSCSRGRAFRLMTSAA